MEQIEQRIERDLAAMDSADPTQCHVAQAKTIRLQDIAAKLTQRMEDLEAMARRLKEALDGQVSLSVRSAPGETGIEPPPASQTDRRSSARNERHCASARTMAMRLGGAHYEIPTRHGRSCVLHKPD
jgi:hypothetical protein